MLYILRKTLWMSTDFQTDSKKRRDARERDLKREREREKKKRVAFVVFSVFVRALSSNKSRDVESNRFS